MISDDEFLERLVAGMCAATAKDAKVLWDYHVNGRQFDVAIFFQRGPFKYSTLIEVKNRKNRIQVSDVEAFVTKAKDHQANKIAFFSSAGFQSGSEEVARRHGVDLFRIYFSDEPPSAAVVRDRLKYAHKFRLKGGAKPTEASYIAFGGKREFISILEVVLIYADDTRCQLPTEQTQAEYVAAKTMIGAVGTLKEVINGLPLPISRLNEMQTFSHAFEPPLQVTSPKFFLKPGLCEGIELRIFCRRATACRETCGWNPPCFPVKW